VIEQAIQSIYYPGLSLVKAFMSKDPRYFLQYIYTKITN